MTMQTEGRKTLDPMWTLSGSELDELELLCGGLYAPAMGYCLPSQIPQDWPAAFPLAVPLQLGQEASSRGYLLLTDPDGTPLARVEVADTQPSADELSMYVAGPLTKLHDAEHPPARHLRITCPLPRSGENNSTIVAAIFSETPQPWQLAAAMASALRTQSQLWLIALCGPQKHGRYTVQRLLNQLESTVSQIDSARAGLIVVPAVPHAASPRDRVLQEHALRCLGADQVLDYTAVNAASSWPPEVANPLPPSGMVVFFTGLSGSGKSTVARALAEDLQRGQTPVTLLDGDDVRRILSPGLGFSKADREANIARIGWVASLLSSAGAVAICAPIAPFDQTRQQVRKMAESVGKFMLVHISTPLQVCEARDRKGLYAKARRGEIKDFTGIDSPYEYPYDAHLHLDTSEISVGDAVTQIRRALAAVGNDQPRTAKAHP